MKRRIQGLSSGTTSSTKKRSWRDDDDDEVAGNEKKSPALSDSDLENALDAAATKAQDRTAENVYAQNPVVWMDISVAGKPRGKVYFELFSDTASDAAEVMRSLCTGSLKGTEFHKIVPRKFMEGGDIDLPDSVIEAGEKAKSSGGKVPTMLHSKAGLLSCKPAGPNGMTSLIFQVTLAASPQLDRDQIVFGQVVDAPDRPADKLHPLHWVSAAGSSAGEPRDTVLVEDCGICDAALAEKITGQPQLMEPPYPPPESQDERYSRAGNAYTALSDAMSTDNVADALELTEDLVDYLEWTSKRAKKEGGGGGTRMLRSAEIEAELKNLRAVLDSAESKAGEVNGFEGKLGRNLQSQLNRIKDLSEILNRVF